MVFDTLRTGFPDAETTVWVNGGDTIGFNFVMDDAKRCGCLVVVSKTTTHHRWVIDLLNSETEPFYLLDTDVVFFGEVESWNFGESPLAGYYIPRFFDRFANAATQPRLHTSLLRINPVRVKKMVTDYANRSPDVYCLPKPALEDLVFPRYVPLRFGCLDKTMFYDTMSLMFNAIGGTAFSDQQKDQYGHLNFGTLSDVVAPHYPGGDIREHHFACFENPSLLKGQWQRDKAFYAARAC